MNCLHLVPKGGIANRVRALVSALWMTERLGTELFVTWRSEKFLPASWEDLYEGTLPSPPPSLEERDTLRLEEPTFIDLSDPDVKTIDVLEVRTCHGFSFRPEIRALSYRFWAAVRPYLLRLTPSPEVLILADRIARHFGPHVLGVHLRTGGGAIEFRTPRRAMRDEFFTEIDRIREKAPRMQDDFVHRDFRTTDSVEDVQVALAELVLLSRTERLLGTFFSSFGVLAGAMGALPYKELCKPDKESRWRQFEPKPFEAGD